MSKLISISEVSKMLKLVDPKTKKPLNHVLRYWEKEFYQIKPKIINNRRYYSKKNIEIIKNIKFLTKVEKVSIDGVKKILKKKIKVLDDNKSLSLKKDIIKNKLKNKSLNILSKLKDIKKYGKKNTS